MESPFLNNISKPSIALKLLVWLVRSKILTRGYGWLLIHIPAFFWGGKNIRVRTEIGELVISSTEKGSITLLFFGCLPNEERESLVIRKLMKICKVTIDIGAHIGWYACLMDRFLNPLNKKIIAFEPNPIIYPYLQENSRLRPAIEVYPFAVGANSENATYYCSNNSGLGSTVREVGIAIPVKCITLDEFAKSNDLINKIDFIKCDIEGGEVDVIRGAKLTMNQPNPPIWMLEIDRNLLNEIGVSLTELEAEILANGGTTRFIYLDDVGNLIEVNHLDENSPAINIFVVPEVKWQLFNQCMSELSI